MYSCRPLASSVGICVSMHLFFFLDNGNCCNYNHFRTPLLAVGRPNCKVQAGAGSLLLERSHIMVSNARGSSPCQHGPACTQASGQMPVMSGRTRDPQFLIKAFREQAHVPQLAFPWEGRDQGQATPRCAIVTGRSL